MLASGFSGGVSVTAVEVGSAMSAACGAKRSKGFVGCSTFVEGGSTGGITSKKTISVFGFSIEAERKPNW